MYSQESSELKYLRIQYLSAADKKWMSGTCLPWQNKLMNLWQTRTSVNVIYLIRLSSSFFGKQLICKCIKLQIIFLILHSKQYTKNSSINTLLFQLLQCIQLTVNWREEKKQPLTHENNHNLGKCKTANKTTQEDNTTGAHNNEGHLLKGNSNLRLWKSIWNVYGNKNERHKKTFLEYTSFDYVAKRYL